MKSIFEIINESEPRYKTLKEIMSDKNSIFKDIYHMQWVEDIDVTSVKVFKNYINKSALKKLIKGYTPDNDTRRLILDKNGPAYPEELKLLITWIVNQRMEIIVNSLGMNKSYKLPDTFENILKEAGVIIGDPKNLDITSKFVGYENYCIININFDYGRGIQLKYRINNPWA